MRSLSNLVYRQYSMTDAQRNDLDPDPRSRSPIVAKSSKLRQAVSHHKMSRKIGLLLNKVRFQSQICANQYFTHNKRKIQRIFADVCRYTVTCGLTACALESAPGLTLGNEYGKPLPFLPVLWANPVRGWFISCGTHLAHDGHHTLLLLNTPSSWWGGHTWLLLSTHCVCYHWPIALIICLLPYVIFCLLWTLAVKDLTVWIVKLTTTLYLTIFKDRDSKFRLILVESRIHRLARYYKTKKVLPPNWK